jgi:hypothetical protein
MKHFPLPRKTASLSESVQQQLNMYALAATAAGVGMFALAQKAEARIVYTPAHVPIVERVNLNLDLNHDGIADFAILKTAYSHFGFMDARSLGSNRIWGSNSSGRHFASALAAGVHVGPNKGKFQKGAVSCLSGGTCKLMYRVDFASGSSSRTGPWANTTKAYLGLKFHIKGKIHFGWARLRQDTKHHWFLTGYAYETIANKSIVTGKTKGTDFVDGAAYKPSSASIRDPKPATLGLLSTGSSGLSIWRRKE